MKIRFVIIILMASICVAVVFIVSNITKDKEYSDVKIEGDLTTISNCVECAKATLDLKDKDVYLSDFNITYDNYRSEYAGSVRISFVSINKFRFLSPYIWYSIKLDIKNNIATEIERKYCKYIVYDDLNFQQWKLDLDNALTDEKVKEILKNYEIMQDSEVKIITYNDTWDYIFINSDRESVRVEVNPK